MVAIGVLSAGETPALGAVLDALLSPLRILGIISPEKSDNEDFVTQSEILEGNGRVPRAAIVVKSGKMA